MTCPACQHVIERGETVIRLSNGIPAHAACPIPEPEGGRVFSSLTWPVAARPDALEAP